MPGGSLDLLEEVKNNTHHYISVIADAADSQLAMLTTTGSVPADVYDNLQETVRCPTETPTADRADRAEVGCMYLVAECMRVF